MPVTMANDPLVVSALTPLPDHLKQRFDRPAVREWFREHRDQLQWNSEREMFEWIGQE